jgi:alanyl-tRNA synthetase
MEQMVLVPGGDFMIKLTADELRENYLEFFESKNHLRLPSYSLVPVNDPTLLIIGAGMAPLKPYFKGEAKPPHPRITTCQKCVRVGDIEQVGRTARHHTLFEMLGNFSFGDYYKKETILWAWEYFTRVLKFPVEKLYVTIHTGDDEAEKIWMEEVGLKRDRIFRSDDNFWGPVGDTGPCGPDSELLIDRGPHVGCGTPQCKPGCDCDRYLELWNLVFTGLYKNEEGKYENLPSQCIDTGMGFERLVSYMAGKSSAFDTELFQGIMDRIGELSGRVTLSEAEAMTYRRVIADHVRSVVFMAGDGITPSNEGRGYVMRRLIRRSVRFARELGFDQRSLTLLIEPVVKKFGPAYPELVERKDYVEKIIGAEEENFRHTLSQGLAHLETILAGIRQAGGKTLPGGKVFVLYDTYGFPRELTCEIAEEQGFSVEMEGFQSALEEQRQRARSSQKSKMDSLAGEMDLSGYSSQFTGYGSLEETSSVLGLFAGGQKAGALSEGQTGEMVLDRTCFYGESGGQVGDAGTFEGPSCRGTITDTRKTPSGVNLHIIQVEEGSLGVGEKLKIKVEAGRRRSIMRHHTATHLLQAALRSVLGQHVGQMGSMVAPDRFRFDFSHHAALTPDETAKIEEMVNYWVLENFPVSTDELSLPDALEKGALAFFGEKYEEKVRVVSVPGVSAELCGGTHVSRTGDIGCFKVSAQSAIGMGIRRLEGVCGMPALKRFQEEEATLSSLALSLNTDMAGLPGAVARLRDALKQAEKELKAAREELAKASIKTYVECSQKIDDVTLVARRVDGMDRDEIRGMADLIAGGLKLGVVILGGVIDGKVALFVRLTDDMVARGLSAVSVIKDVASLVGGGGGGNPRMAQAGGKDPSRLDAAIEKSGEILKEQLGKMRVIK